MAAPYSLTGKMADGTSYTASGEMQPDGVVLFRVPQNARVQDCVIERASDAQMPTSYVVEKATVV
jgi:hypothetical protein